MASERLQAMTDEQLQEWVEEAQDEQERRKKAKRQKAIDDAKALLAAAGLSLKDALSSGTGKGKGKKAGQPLKQGQRYVNPANPSEVYTVGRGRRPKWFADLEAKGQTPAPEARK